MFGDYEGGLDDTTEALGTVAADFGVGAPDDSWLVL